MTNNAYAKSNGDGLLCSILFPCIPQVFDGVCSDGFSVLSLACFDGVFSDYSGTVKRTVTIKAKHE
jgi:hypothetical protein